MIRSSLSEAQGHPHTNACGEVLKVPPTLLSWRNLAARESGVSNLCNTRQDLKHRVRGQEFGERKVGDFSWAMGDR